MLSLSADAPPARNSPPPPVAAGRLPLAAWAVLALALLLRLLWLGEKPAHFDEGVNGFFIDQMRQTGFYHYDPGNYHGPFHFYVLFFAQALFGRDVAALRLPLALAGAATVWLIFLYRRFLPWRICFWAGLAFAVSPGEVFYARYAIHEAWLVLGLVLGIWGAAELWKYGTRTGLHATAAGVTLLILTKETYVIHLAALGLAFGTLVLLEKLRPSSPPLPLRPAPRRWSRYDGFNTTAASLIVVLFFYSGGFLDPASLHGLYETFAAWFATGVTEHSGHEKPFHYWLELMGRYEWPAALGLLLSVRALWPGLPGVLRFLAIYGAGTLVAYSLVPYKTPWCVISIIWPFFFLFGYGVDWLARRARWVAMGAAGLFLAASAAYSARLSLWRPTDFQAEQYVYVQTLNDLDLLTKPLEELARRDPSIYHLPICIHLSSCHPLPWVLGEYTAVGYYSEADAVAPVERAVVIVAEEDRVHQIEAALSRPYFRTPFQLRDGMAGGRLYLDAERFAPLFPGRVPEFHP